MITLPSLIPHHALIGQALVLEQRRDRVKPESAHTALQPETNHVLECRCTFGLCQFKSGCWI